MSTYVELIRATEALDRTVEEIKAAAADFVAAVGITERDRQSARLNRLIGGSFHIEGWTLYIHDTQTAVEIVPDPIWE